MELQVPVGCQLLTELGSKRSGSSTGGELLHESSGLVCSGVSRRARWHTRHHVEIEVLVPRVKPLGVACAQSSSGVSAMRNGDAWCSLSHAVRLRAAGSGATYRYRQVAL
jgi:hypothetical protein